MTHMDGCSARRGIAAHLVEIPPKVNKGRKSTCCHSSKSLFVSQYYTDGISGAFNTHSSSSGISDEL